MKIEKILRIFFIFIFTVSVITGNTYVVAESGGDYSSIQETINITIAGDTILVREKNTPYFEKITFSRSGNAANGHIVLMAYPNETPIFDGQYYSAGGDWPEGLLRIINKSYIKAIGFEIRNIVVSNNILFPAGIWIYGALNNVEILNNKIHTIEQNASDAGAHGLAVYGNHSSIPISDVLIDDNEIYNCKLGWSESLVLNGNVENFTVSNNVVHDNNNIAYDFIGHEGECPNPFNPETTIKFRISPDTKYPISLRIYDSLGRKVLSKEFKTHTSNEVTYHWNAAGNSSGIYYVVLRSIKGISNKQISTC